MKKLKKKKKKRNNFLNKWEPLQRILSIDRSRTVYMNEIQYAVVVKLEKLK